MRLRPLLWSLLLVPSLVFALEKPEIPWGLDPTAGSQLAEKTLRPMLLLFTGEPCATRDGTNPRGTVAESDCARLERDVLSQPETVAVAARYVPLIFSRTALQTGQEAPAQREIFQRYQVATHPTVLLADPWGNEMIRMVHFTPKEKLVPILAAMPKDFATLRAAGQALKEDPVSLPALLDAAAFYEKTSLRIIAERYYERALEAPSARKDEAERRRAVLARGLNLLKLGRIKDAAKTFAKEGGRPDGPLADGLLFGRALCEIAAGEPAKAQAMYQDLSARFPNSLYRVRLEQELQKAGH